MTATQSAGEFLDQFDPDELSEERIDFDLGDDGRCIQTMLFHRNQVVWFSVVTQVAIDGHWYDVARADTCHDEAHLHRYVRGRRAEVGRHVLRSIGTIEDAEAGFDEACDRLLDDWEDNVRRWRNGK